MTNNDNDQARDLRAGVAINELDDPGLLAGQIDGKPALLVRNGDRITAIGASCTHYHGPLAEGLLDGNNLYCPWHHACFNVTSGEAVRAPALDPLPCWQVTVIAEQIHIGERLSRPGARKQTSLTADPSPHDIVIVGGGAAGLAAAEMLRREGYQGTLTMLSRDDYPPCDRPNLSKEYLAGKAEEDWIPLRTPNFYHDHAIDLHLESPVVSLDRSAQTVRTQQGDTYRYDSLLLAPGAEPITVELPGAEAGQVHYLRRFADSQAIVARANTAKRAAIIGSSFIGLEVAASLRARGLEVHVIGRNTLPLERALGRELGLLVQELHEANGVVFHMNNSVHAVDGPRVVLADSTSIDADLLVVGIGVKPVIDLAAAADLQVGDGIIVDEYLQTSHPAIYAAGDIACWPYRGPNNPARVEHWVVAERQGQVSARNMLGAMERFDSAPFFWSQHYDLIINYTGYAKHWDSISIDGSLAARDCTVKYLKAGHLLAAATIGRDIESLLLERDLEREP